MTEQPSSTSTTGVIHLRVPIELHRAIGQWARQTHRSITGATMALVEHGIEHTPDFPTLTASSR